MEMDSQLELFLKATHMTSDQRRLTAQWNWLQNTLQRPIDDLDLYLGPHLPHPPCERTAELLHEHLLLKPDVVLHPKYAAQLLVHARSYFKGVPRVVDVPAPEVTGVGRGPGLCLVAG